MWRSETASHLRLGYEPSPGSVGAEAASHQRLSKHSPWTRRSPRPLQRGLGGEDSVQNNTKMTLVLLTVLTFAWLTGGTSQGKAPKRAGGHWATPGHTPMKKITSFFEKCLWWSSQNYSFHSNFDLWSFQYSAWQKRKCAPSTSVAYQRTMAIWRKSTRVPKLGGWPGPFCHRTSFYLEEGLI